MTRRDVVLLLSLVCFSCEYDLKKSRKVKGGWSDGSEYEDFFRGISVAVLTCQSWPVRPLDEVLKSYFGPESFIKSDTKSR